MTLICAMCISLALALSLACVTRPPRSPDVTEHITLALQQAGLSTVTVNQDRAKSAVTLNGIVGSPEEKDRAESIARSIAGAQVISNRIVVRTSDDTKALSLDSLIQSDLEDIFTKHKLRKVKCEVKHGVVTLTGEVMSTEERETVEKLVAGARNVTQVVNQVEIAHAKAKQ